MRSQRSIQHERKLDIWEMILCQLCPGMLCSSFGASLSAVSGICIAIGRSEIGDRGLDVGARG